MIYLDNAASTATPPEVLAAVMRAAEQHFANPSSAHGLGAAAARALEEARTELATLLRADPAELTFTSGGTEANALGILGAAGVARGRHVVLTAIEHPAVLRTADLLKSRGFETTVVAPQPDGTVTPESVAAAMRPDTALCAVMLVNNEIGTVQPLAAIARAVRAASDQRLHLHVDAVQAVGLGNVHPHALGVDSLALSGHKLHGPKGTGALWLRPGVRLAPLWDGGRQERGLRSGTENLPAFVGLARAATLCRVDADAPARVAGLRDRLESLVFDRLPEARPTVPLTTPRAPHISSITLPYLPAEPILHALEARKVHASAGSACASRTRGPSHVLRAIGSPETAAVIRFSLSRETRAEEIEPAATAFADAVAEISAVAASPRKARRS